MPIDVYLWDSGDERWVATLSDPLLKWFDGAARVLGTSSPFGPFDPYATVTLSATTGDVASFASALQRTLGSLESVDVANLPGLPVVPDERDDASGELGRDEIVTLVQRILTAALKADVEGAAIIARGD